MDDTGEQLQRELELFAQDDDGEEQALMIDDNNANQDSYNDPQSWAGSSEQQAQPGTDDLDELEKYFDQKQY